MNKLCKTFAAVLSFHSTEKWLLPSIFILQSPLYSTTSLTKQTHSSRSKPEPSDSEPENLGIPAAAKFTKKEIIDWPRPSEIPFQVKVANSVSLIGSIAVPVQFESSPDGKSWAGAIITQQKTEDFPAFWIPVIFEGDLAHVAVCHLKENDLVHVSGRLSADTPPFTVGKGQASVQVMVQSVSFVQDSYEKKKRYAPKHDVEGLCPGEESADNYWLELVNHPERWRDFRKDKMNGKVKQGHPDFKCKEDGHALWLNKAPISLLPKLEQLEFYVEISATNIRKDSNPLPLMNIKKEVSWKSLVENPDKWWDNRLDKRNKKAPDFKHKGTGEALWINSSPAWALPKLPPLRAKNDFAASKRDSLLS